MVFKKRGEGRLPIDVGTKDLYQFYINRISKIESIKGGKTRGSFEISQTQYSDILKEINSGIVDLMILENFEFKIPCSLGYKSIKQRKIKVKLDLNGNLDKMHLSPNWKATRDLWSKDNDALIAKTVIYHTNEHTNNYKMHYEWSKSGATTTGIGAYYFIVCRDNKRYLGSCLQSNNKLQFYEPAKKKEPQQYTPRNK